MIHFSLFSGIGGFDLASEWAGWKNYLSCEINEFGNKVLNYYWPEAYHHTDIKTLTYDTINAELSKRFGTDWRNDDIIISGGFPCQPFSTAGKRLGKEDERHLWPEMLRVIREVRPKYVVGENVRGLLSWSDGLVLEEVYADLEGEGYEVQPFVLPAVSINAPHRRDRVYIIATDTKHTRLEGQHRKWEGRSEYRNNEGLFFGTENKFITADTKFNGLEHAINGRSEDQENGAQEKGGQVMSSELYESAEAASIRQLTTDTDSHRLERSISPNFNKQKCSSKEHDEKHIPTYEYGLQFKNFPTQSPICGGDDGFPTKLDGITISRWRKESVMAYGNAIVPQLVYRIFDTINKIENEE
jgi:DNA (cytosine-5)-methyltransferase 1